MELILSQIRLDQIVTATPLPQPRALLLESMEQFGQLDPVHARPLEEDRYQVTAGEGCLAGARALGWESLGAIVETSEAEALPTALRTIVLNEQRQSLTLLHKSRLARDLVENERYSQRKVAGLLSRSPATLSLMLKVLRCPELETAAERDGLPFSAAMELTALEEGPRRGYLAELRAQTPPGQRFPSVDAIRRGVRERQGKPGFPALDEGLLPSLLAELLAGGAAVELEVATARKPRIRVEVGVSPAEREQVVALMERLRAGERKAAA